MNFSKSVFSNGDFSNGNFLRCQVCEQKVEWKILFGLINEKVVNAIQSSKSKLVIVLVIKTVSKNQKTTLQLDFLA